MSVGGGVDDGVMGSRRRRQRVVEQARAVPLVGHSGCGCTGLARLVYRASCGDCGRTWDHEVVLPSNGGAGDVRDVFCSCPCGGDATGVGRIVELLGDAAE